MDFSYSDEQLAVGELARQILEDKTSSESMRALEKSDGPRFDPALWSALSESGLIGIAIPEDCGGGGLGFLEVAVILEQLAHATAPVPLYETMVLGALPLVEFGSEEQKKRWLPQIAEGTLIVTTALEEAGADPLLPTTRAVARDDGFVLSGEKISVPAAPVAHAILIPASLPDGGVGVFLVPSGASGLEIEPVETTTRQPEAIVRLHDVVVDVDARLGAETSGDSIVEWIRLRAIAALCSMSAGVCDAALHLTSEYVKTRKQFDQPIAMFQAVGHRAADAYIDAEAVRLTAQQAAWRIAEGRPSDSQVAVAKYFACEAGNRVMLAAQHLHGGVGVDRDYPLHRYYLYAKQLELALGGGSEHLRTLGGMLASDSATF